MRSSFCSNLSLLIFFYLFSTSLSSEPFFWRGLLDYNCVNKKLRRRICKDSLSKYVFIRCLFVSSVKALQICAKNMCACVSSWPYECVCVCVVRDYTLKTTRKKEIWWKEMKTKIINRKSTVLSILMSNKCCLTRACENPRWRPSSGGGGGGAVVRSGLVCVQGPPIKLV